MVPVAERKPGPKPCRRMGLAVVAVGTLGAAVGVLTRPKQLTPMEHVSGMVQDFVRGFSERQLSPLEGLFACDAKFLWVDEEHPEEPSAMTIEASLAQAEQQHPHLQFQATFVPKEGHLDDLLNQFQAVKDGMLAYFEARYGARMAQHQ